eukprot:TRINITY_DN1708_c0_g1_i4.p1 TRINITY_DN1708_c0_g1~~TRINITY_DN1708_c0_g1_i4.p1  ORF type:complete len:171 (-),score=52.57 TRINITY_DN1708_c0_g1_i4:850-1362(-)
MATNSIQINNSSKNHQQQHNNQLNNQNKKCIDCTYFFGKESNVNNNNGTAIGMGCRKGEHCEYRHNANALNTTTICNHWTLGLCNNVSCSERHPFLPSNSNAMADNRKQIPCHYFIHSICSKGESCPFSHQLKPNLTLDSSTSISPKENDPTLVQKQQELQKLKYYCSNC